MSERARPVLLISRGTMSGGKIVAGCLAEHEGYRCVTREDLLSSVNRHGDIAARITAQVARGVEAYEEFTDTRRVYLILMRRALLEYALSGPLAYFGYSGHLLLRPLRHFIRVRLIAPMEVRIERTRELLGYSEPAARAYVRQMDQERASWARMVYGVDLRDPALYDFCVNVERLSMAGVCGLLRDITRRQEFQPTPESVDECAAYYLATQVLAALATDPRSTRFDFCASVVAATATISGPPLSAADLDLVLSLAGSVPGIAAVEYQAAAAAP